MTNAIADPIEAGIEAASEAVAGDPAMMRTPEALYQEAIALVARAQKPSPSYLQRTMRIGWDDAVALIERMQADGLCSAPNRCGIRRMVAEHREPRDAR